MRVKGLYMILAASTHVGNFRLTKWQNKFISMAENGS